VRAAETIVGRAWAERLLRYCDRMDCALEAAHEQYEAAYVRLVAAQRNHDPSEISLAHAALEHAVDVCGTSETAREQGRQALQTALDVLARMGGDGMDAAQADQAEVGSPEPAPAVVPGTSIRQGLSADGALAPVRRALRRIGRLRTRRTPGPGPGQP
jgi:hypothetical protein